MTLKIGHKIFLLVAIPLVFILVVITLFTFVQRSTAFAAAQADHSDAVLSQTRLLWETMLDAEDNQRGYVLTRDPLYLEQFRRADSQVPQLLTKLEQLVRDNPGQETKVHALRVVAALRLQRLEKSVDSVRARAVWKLDPAELSAKLHVGTRLMGDLRSQMAVFTDEEIRLQTERAAGLARSLDVFNNLLVACAIAAFALSLVIMQTFSRVLVRRLTELEEEARTFAEGGALKPATEQGNDEIAQLRRSFHAMAGERQRAENDREKFFDRSNDLMCVANFEGYFTRMNPAWESMLKHSRDELARKPFLEFVHPDDRQSTIDAMSALSRGDSVTSFENRYRHNDGSYVWLAWSAIPSLEEGLIYAVARDVTRRKEIEAELARSRDQAMEASLLKSQFLANMSHEIRTPMNGIVATSELLLRSKVEGDEREYAGIISESARALLTIINQILDLSKLEAGRFDLESADFSPVMVVENVADLLKVQATQKKLSLHTFVADDVPQNVRGDAGRVRQILLNLLGNAVKFTEHGAVALRVSRDGDDDAQVTLRFTVTDTGVGMPPQAREKLFEPFTQADGSTSRRFGGTGLGLSISKRLVELMSGEIGVESEPGAGSTFWFTARFAKTGADAQQTFEAPLRNRRVLIVDSDPTASDIIARYVHAWGVRSAATSDINGVIPLMREGVDAGDPFHFLIVDLSTAGIDAWRLSDAIANDAPLSVTKLILATTLDGRERLQQSDKFAAYLSKPVKQSQLHDCIVTAMDASATKSPVSDRHTPVALRKASAENGRSENGSARILLAEDHAINRRIALAQLKELGLEAEVATNGQEAIDAYVKHRYDIILMDCQMPEVDGFTATRAIRAIQARDGGEVQIVAMTANAMEGDRKACIEAGMDSYLSKPVELDKLRNVLLPLVRRARTPNGRHNGAAVRAGSAARALDFDRLQRVFHGDAEAIREVLELSVAECRPLAAALQSAVARRDSVAAAQAAHKFKGICGNVGADELAAIGLHIERAVSSADWASAQEGCNEVGAALSRFMAAATTAQSRSDEESMREA